MATLLMESFDYLSTVQDDATITGISVPNNITLSGGPDAHSGGTATGSMLDTRAGIIIPGKQTEIYAGWWMYFTQLGGEAVVYNVPFLRLGDPVQRYDDPHVELNFTTRGSLLLTRDVGTATLIDTAANIVNILRWHFIEIRLLLGTTTGAVELKVDGVSVGTATSTNTTSAGTSTSTSDIIGTFDLIGTSFVPWYISGLYINDTTGSAPNNGFMGPHIMETLRPNGAGFSTGFTPSAGSNWQNVDEDTQDGHTTYNEAATAATIDSFTYSNLVNTATSIPAIGLNTICRKEGLPGSKKLRSRVRSSASDALGTAIALKSEETNSRYMHTRQIIEKDPNGTIAWTSTSVNAAEAGYEVTV